MNTSPLDQVKIDLQSLFASSRINVKITGAGRAKWRLRIASWFFSLGAKIMPIPTNVTIDTQPPAPLNPDSKN